MSKRWMSEGRYRARAVVGEVEIKQIPNESKTRYVEVMLEVTSGEMTGERVRWRGYLNSVSNAERAATELRAMGWRGGRWGDWSGIGSREVQFTCMIDQNGGKSYPRAAFVQEPPTLKRENLVDANAIDELNRLFGGAAKAPPPPNGVDPTAPTVAAPGEPAEVTGDEIPF